MMYVLVTFENLHTILREEINLLSVLRIREEFKLQTSLEFIGYIRSIVDYNIYVRKFAQKLKSRLLCTDSFEYQLCSSLTA